MPGKLAGAWLAASLLLLPAAHAATEEPGSGRRSERMRTRDGVELATDVYLPAGGGPFPALLLRTPYNKDSGAGWAKEGVRRGFAVVVQDTRGRYASEGENLPFHLDGSDGEDLVRWVRAQPWSNGRLGSWGGSAGAITQYQLMTRDVRPFDAQFLVVGAPNLHDVVYTGGVFRKSLIEDWLRATRFATNALPVWEAHSHYDDYWRARDTSRHYRTVGAAGVHLGGWWDIFAQATIDAFVGYQQRGAREARGRQKLVMGPWTHGVLQDKAGELRFRDGRNPPGDTEDAWRWFDRWLKDVPNGAEADPPVRYYVLGDVDSPDAPGNAWRTAATWPPFDLPPTRFYLHADRTLSPSRPDTGRAPLAYLHDPAHPVPTVGGIQLTLPAGPMDQRRIEGREDVLVFSTEPLAEPLEVTGRVRARLWITSDSPDTDFHVRLCDVYPDGRSFNLCEGALRARFRAGPDRERLLEPGRPTPVDIDVWSTSVIFNRGHRIRVHVASSSAPGFDPNPNTGAPFRSGTAFRTARNQVFVDRRHPSHVLLPVVPAARNAPDRGTTVQGAEPVTAR